MINPDEKFFIEGDDRIFTTTGTGISEVAGSVDEWAERNDDARTMASSFRTLSISDADNLWRSILDAGSSRYGGQFTNMYSGVTLSNTQDIANYLGRQPLGTLPTRSEELAGNTTGLTSGSALNNLSPFAGTPEQVYEQAKTSLPPAQAPTNAGDISNDFTTPNIPNTDETYGNPSEAIAGTTGMDTYLKTLMEQNADYEAQRVEMEKARQEENQTFLQKLLSTTTSPMDARDNAWDQTGITPTEYFAEEKAKIAEIGALSQEYNAAKAAMEQQIAATQDKLGSMNFINNQTAQIQRNAAPTLNMISANINAKAATLQALQGRFNEAQNYVNQAVQDATADYKYKMDVFQTFYQMNQDSINRLDSIYSDAFKTSMNLATMAYEQQYKEKQMIGELMINPDYAGAGISINDTFAQALNKARTWIQANPSVDTQYKLAQIANMEADNARLARGGGTTTSSGVSTEVRTLAQAYADQEITIENVPQALRAQVIAEANRIAAEALAPQTSPNVGLPKIGTGTPVDINKATSSGGLQWDSPQSSTTTTKPLASSTVLKVGSTGDAVKQLQTMLGITADGIFGPQTQSAVLAYQKANGLTADGIVGPQTIASLNGTTSYAGSFFSSLFG